MAAGDWNPTLDVPFLSWDRTLGPGFPFPAGRGNELNRLLAQVRHWKRDDRTMAEAQAMVQEEQERLAYLAQWLEWAVSDGPTVDLGLGSE